MAKATLAERIMNTLATDGPRYTRQMAATLEAANASISEVCFCLRKKGLIHSVEGLHGLTRAGRTLLENGGFIPCQRKGRSATSAGRTLRQRAWSIMRMTDHFTLNSLLHTICNGDEGNAEDNLRQYCRALEKVGILGRTARTRAWFLRAEANTGPLAPACNRAEKCVTDRNTGKVYALEAVHA